ncbi:hypothetical protein T492DRAFT_842429 [Pavlovales sp. CCMP2436]|nr:hypothetical protein T492DRAFT_842429 [Pavlovales sp. CCMP2436]
MRLARRRGIVAALLLLAVAWGHANELTSPLREHRRHKPECEAAGHELSSRWNCAIALGNKRRAGAQFAAAAHHEWNDLLLKPLQARAIRGADATSQIYQAVLYEPFALFHKFNDGKPSNWLHSPLVSAPRSVPWWRAYTTILILRDPVARFWRWMDTFLDKGEARGGQRFGEYLRRALAATSSAGAADSHHPPLCAIYHTLHNSKTALLVPSLLLKLSSCGPSELKAALDVAARFAYVLDLTDRATREVSYQFVEQAFG